MSMDFVNAPAYNGYGLPLNPQGNIAPNFSGNIQQQPNMQMQQQQAALRAAMANLETPKITTGGSSFKFSVKTDKDVMIPVDPEITDVEAVKRKAGPGRQKKETTSGIVRADSTEKLSGTVEDTPTMYTYMETTGMLRETLAQIDSLNAELMQEFNMVRNSRTLKNKYNTLIGLSENVGALLNGKISAIREINSAITKSNDLDYKKDKDRKAAAAGQDDDQFIANFYQSMMQNPINRAPSPQLPQVDPSLFGSGVVRADIRSGDINGNGPVDAAYLSYISNLTPEQNMMQYEGNPNVKQVVVFDASTGNKFFQMMDMSTGQAIPNVPVYDQMFMEDTTLDLKTKIAKNINLNETFPIVVINEGVTAQY